MMVLRGLGGVFGGSREFWGGLGGVQRGYFSPIRHILPLWKSCKAPDFVPNTT